MRAIDIIRHGLDHLDDSALKQIAAHLEHVVGLASNCALEDGTMLDLVRSEEWDLARQLASYCRAVVRVKEARNGSGV